MSQTLEAPAPVAGYPLHRRVLDVFVSPGHLFEHFRERTPWVGPLIIAIVAGLLVVMLIPQDLFVAQAREAMRGAAQQGAQMPPPEQMATYARVFGSAGVALGTPIMAFAFAGVLALVFSVIGGGNAGYAQYLAVTTHSFLITSLGGLVTLPVQILRGDLETRLSLVLFAPFLETGTLAYRVLQGLEVFTIWALVVAALGVAVVNRRTSWGSATAILGGAYVLVLFAIALIASR
jgi:hypothetical protein